MRPGCSEAAAAFWHAESEVARQERGLPMNGLDEPLLRASSLTLRSGRQMGLLECWAGDTLMQEMGALLWEAWFHMGILPALSLVQVVLQETVHPDRLLEGHSRQEVPLGAAVAATRAWPPARESDEMLLR